MDIQILPVFNSKYITKLKIILQKKISKKKMFGIEINLKRRKQILKLDKIFDVFFKFKIKNIFSNYRIIKNLGNIRIKGKGKKRKEYLGKINTGQHLN